MKREKLEQVNRLVQKLGLLFQKVKEAFSAKVVVNSAVARKYETPKRVFPGMYVYADGLIYPEIIEGRQVMAVVGSVNGSDVLAVCLKEKSLPWSSDWLEVETSQDMTSGKEATATILAAAKRTGLKAEAAQWCYGYTYDGVTQGEAFLPSLTEQEKLYANKKAINKSLSALKAQELGGWYWSSSEYGNGDAWIFGMSNGSRNRNLKYTNVNYSRPVIAIQL